LRFHLNDTAQHLQHFYAVLLHTKRKGSTKAREKGNRSKLNKKDQN
jgi:hypothetical protein